MKSLKLLLFTFVCTFASPIAPAFAIVEAVGSPHSMQSQVLTPKKVDTWADFIFHIFGIKQVSEREALIMGVVSLVLAGLCGWYLLTHNAMLISTLGGLLTYVFNALSAIVLVSYILIYAILLISYRLKSNARRKKSLNQ